MTKRILSMVAVAMVLAVLVPLSVTTSASELNCRVPFSFIVNGKTLPAGGYSVSTAAGHMVLRGSRGSVVAIARADTEAASGYARLVFLKTGDRYDLSEVWMGDGGGLQLSPAKRTIDERSASNAKTELVVVNANVH